MDYINLRRQAASIRKGLFEQGYLDEQFYQLEDLQDDASPNFVEEVVTLFFRDSLRLMANIDQALDKCAKDFNKLDVYMQQLMGSCTSIGASKIKTECTAFRDYCRYENIEGCMRSFQKLKREHSVLRQKLESYFQENFDKGMIYPPFPNIREISAHIAANVAAKAYELGLATRLPCPKDLIKYAKSCMYSPVYRSYR